MADIREQDLALKTTLADTDWIRLVTPTGNHKMTVGQFKDLIGHIEESGSNTNGRYIRFSDGTQICWHSITWTGVLTNATAYGVWTFPAVFSNVEIPALSITAQNSSTTPANASILTSGEYSTDANSVAIRGIAVKNTSSSTRDITAHLIAIGRWYFD